MRRFAWRSLPELILVIFSPLVALLLFMTQTFLPSLQNQTHGFAAYYTGAWMAQHGHIADLYDPTAFNAAMQATGIKGIYDIYDANAPLLVVLTWPLAWWSPMTARAIWLWFNLALDGVAAISLYKWWGQPKPLYFGLIVAAVLLYAPLQENFRLGQVYLPFLVGALLMLVWPNPAGGTLGLIIQLVVKLYYGLFGLIWVLARPKIVLLSTAITITVAVILLPWFGPNLWGQYFQLASTFNQRPYIGVTAYQTLNGFFSHFFHYDSTWNSHPIADWGSLAGLLSLVVEALLTVVSGWVIWQTGWHKRSWHINPETFAGVVALVLALAPILAPAAEEYHFTLLLLPLVVSFKLWLNQPARKRSEGAMWLVAVLLLGPAWPYKSWPERGWEALWAYPRLYGAIVLWLLLLKQLQYYKHDFLSDYKAE